MSSLNAVLKNEFVNQSSLTDKLDQLELYRESQLEKITLLQEKIYQEEASLMACLQDIRATKDKLTLRGM